MPSICKQEIPGGWTSQKIKVAGKIFDLIVPAVPDELLDDLWKHDTEPIDWIDPFWSQIWPAAIPTATAILQSKWDHQTKVLELGTGIGLVGLAALARGLDATLSDYIPQSVDLAVENARRNGFENVRGTVLDWRQPVGEQFPFILASDVLYDAKNHDSLLNLLKRMLTNEGVCWIGDPGRYHLASFVTLARSSGFKVQLRGSKGERFSQPRSGEFQIVELSRAA